MKRNLFAWMLLIGVLAFSTGCVNTVDGRMRPGNPLSKDKIESSYEVPLEKVFTAARNVLADMGTLVKEDVAGYALEAKVNTRTIYVRVIPVNEQVTRIRTQAITRSGNGDIALASEIDKRVAIQMVAPPSR